MKKKRCWNRLGLPFARFFYAAPKPILYHFYEGRLSLRHEGWRGVWNKTQAPSFDRDTCIFKHCRTTWKWVDFFGLVGPMRQKTLQYFTPSNFIKISIFHFFQQCENGIYWPFSIRTARSTFWRNDSRTPKIKVNLFAFSLLYFLALFKNILATFAGTLEVTAVTGCFSCKNKKSKSFTRDHFTKPIVFLGFFGKKCTWTGSTSSSSYSMKDDVNRWGGVGETFFTEKSMKTFF